MTNSRNNPATARRGMLPPRVPVHRPTGTSTKTRTHPCRPPSKWCSGARSRWCSSLLPWRHSSSGRGEGFDVVARWFRLGASLRSGPAQPAGGVCFNQREGRVPAQRPRPNHSIAERVSAVRPPRWTLRRSTQTTNWYHCRCRTRCPTPLTNSRRVWTCPCRRNRHVARCP